MLAVIYLPLHISKLFSFSRIGQNNVKLLQRSIMFKGSCPWNSLPDELNCHICTLICQTLNKIYDWQVLSSIITIFMSFLIFLYCTMTFWNYIKLYSNCFFACVPITVFSWYACTPVLWLSVIFTNTTIYILRRPALMEHSFW